MFKYLVQGSVFDKCTFIDSFTYCAKQTIFLSVSWHHLILMNRVSYHKKMIIYYTLLLKSILAHEYASLRVTLLLDAPGSRLPFAPSVFFLILKLQINTILLFTFPGDVFSLMIHLLSFSGSSAFCRVSLSSDLL